MLVRNLHENVERRRHELDYTGAALLAGGSSLLLLGLLEGGERWPWLSLPGLGVPAAGVVLLLVFVVVEHRAAEPVLPLWVFRRRLLLTTSLVSLGVGALLFGLTSYVPTFAQGVLGTGPLVAGFALATLTLGWPLSASQSAKLYLRIGFRRTALIGGAVTITGTALMATVGQASSVISVAVYCFLIGAGLGLVGSPTLIASQSSVGWAERGVVTGNNMFNRSMGSALGVAVFGAIANAALPDTAGTHTAADLLTASHRVFVAVAVVAVLTVAAVAAMPDERVPAR